MTSTLVPSGTVILTPFINHDWRKAPMNKTPFETTSRKLEQFFFMHDIRFISFYKNQDGMTVWSYLLDGEGMRVLEEYRRIIARRNQRKGQEK